MDDMIYRNNSIAEENIDPNGRPAENMERRGFRTYRPRLQRQESEIRQRAEKTYQGNG